MHKLFFGPKCNNSCVFCHVDKCANDLSYDSARSMLSALRPGEAHVVFTGGEPTLRKDLPDLIAYARRAGFLKIEIETNGRLLSYPAYLLKLAKAGLTGAILNMPASEKSLFESITQVPGSYEQTKKSFLAILDKGMDLRVVTIICKPNVRHLPAMTWFLARHVKRPLHFQALYNYIEPGGNNLQNIASLMPRLDETRGFLHESLNMARRKSLWLHIHNVPLCLMQGYEGHVHIIGK